MGDKNKISLVFWQKKSRREGSRKHALFFRSTYSYFVHQ